MGFLSGPMTFVCYRVGGSQPKQFGAEHVKALKKFAIGQVENTSTDEAAVGFLAGEHLFDDDFSLEKNVLGDVLQGAMRIDTNQIPSAVRRAWLQIELAALTVDNPSGRPTRFQRQEAREAVEARCEEEARSGRFRRMQQFPWLWDARQGLFYFGGSSAAAADHCSDLFSRSFELELSHLTAGKMAQEWAAEAKRRKALDELLPTSFLAPDDRMEIAWWENDGSNFDYLGNEMLLWLWWRWETQSDTIALPDGSEVTGMFARSLALECPRGESGKETISAEGPTTLPEAAQAIRSGKLPRKAGLTLVRQGEQYDLTLQAETFAVGSAKIQGPEQSKSDNALDDRLESIRSLRETLDQLFHAFCERRIGKDWSTELNHIHQWLKKEAGATRRRT